MCETGKKLNKINFNEFILFYWRQEKTLFFFFCGLAVGGTK